MADAAQVVANAVQQKGELMRPASLTDRMHPMVEIYNLDGEVGSPLTTAMHFSDTLDASENLRLLIVSISSACQDIAKANDLVKRRNPDTIAVAIMIREEQATTSDADSLDASFAVRLRQLRSAFDSVFLVDAADAEEFCGRVARAIITPSGPGMHIGCDWNDMRTLVRGRLATRFDRYGIGCASGQERVELAARAAVLKISLGQVAARMGPSGLLLTIRASRQLRGAEVKQAMQIVRERAAPDSSIAQCIYYDEACTDDIEVEIFEFGATEL